MSSPPMATTMEGIDLKLINDSPAGADQRSNSSSLRNQRTGGGGDYDPYLHRNVPKATTNFETLVHLLKGSLGTGILAMPQAFVFAGLVTGTIATLLIGALCTYCLHVLVKSQYALCKRKRVPLLSYPDSMQLALETGPNFLRPLAKPSNVIVDVFLVVYQLGICCVYIVFIGDSLKKIFDPFVQLKVELWMVFSLGPLIGINLIRNLKILAPFSILANLITFVGIGIIISYLVTNMKSVDSLDMWGKATTFPLFFGTTLFALEAVGVVIALENNMKTPRSFGGTCGVLNIGMTFIVVLYTVFGILGYMRYGGKCEGSVTLNLPDEPLAQSLKGIFVVAVFISYGLQCYPPVEIIWKTYMLRRLQNSNSKLIWEIGLRISLVILTFLLAVAIPRLGLFISLFGAFCLSVLGISFPALMEICVKYPNRFGPYKYILVKDIFLIIVGIIGLVAGTYTALKAIVESFQ